MIQRFVSFIKNIFPEKSRKRQINTKCTFFRKRYSELTVQCLCNEFCRNEDICNYLYENLTNLIIDTYKIPVFELPVELMYCDDAYGLYIFKGGMSVEEQKRDMTENFKKFIILNLNEYQKTRITYPRVEIRNDREIVLKLFTLAHELGHHLIELNGEEQSEELADMKVLEVFQKHFDPIFIGIFNVMLNIYTKLEYNEIVPNFNKFYYDHYVNSPYVEKFNLKLLK